ncbi:hypothetical protein Tco_0796020 [Tanacetum coccineum]
MHSPLQSHMKAALRVLRYLKGSPGLGIQFDRVSYLKLRVFSNADWAKCPKARKFVTVYCVFLAANHVLHEKSKHSKINVHLVREEVFVGVIKTVKIHTDLQVADIFTKCLRVVQHELFCRKLGLFDMFARKKASNGAVNKSLTFSLKGDVQDKKSNSGQIRSEGLNMPKGQSYSMKRKWQAQIDKSSKLKGHSKTCGYKYFSSS